MKITKITKIKDHYEITMWAPARRWFFFWKLPEKRRTYVGDCTVWFCRETKTRASTSLECHFSCIIALRKMDED